MNNQIYSTELDYIKTQDIKNFTETAIHNLPEYFFSVAASSTGKYHPSYALGDGGLVRHTKAAARFANHMFQLDQMQEEFSQEERDCVIASVLLHDGWKHGADGGNHFTTHEHPQFCADWVLSAEVLSNIISEEQRDIIAGAIASHMGQWNENKRSKVILSKPSTKIQKLVHLCDYLASRKDIEILFDQSEEKSAPTVETYVMPFGKHKGETLAEIAKTDISYLKWMKENATLKRPLDKLIPEVLNAKS